VTPRPATDKKGLKYSGKRAVVLLPEVCFHRGVSGVSAWGDGGRLRPTCERRKKRRSMRRLRSLLSYLLLPPPLLLPSWALTSGAFLCAWFHQQVDLAFVKALKNAASAPAAGGGGLGRRTTVNDVLLSAMAGAMRRYCQVGRRVRHTWSGAGSAVGDMVVGCLGV